MQLTPGTTINQGDVVSRQTIFDLISNASIDSVVVETDLSSDTPTHQSASNPPTAAPGTFWWDKSTQLLRVFHDEVDNTGVSLWLAIGPDSYEVEAIASEPIPFGAACIIDFDQGHKWVKLPPSSSDLVAMGHTAARVEPLKVVGFNQTFDDGNFVPDNFGRLSSPVTVASGAWFRLAVAGVVWGWTPFNRSDGGTWLAAGRGVNDVLTIVSGTDFSAGAGGFTSPRGLTLDDARGGLVYDQSYSVMQNGAPSFCLNSVHRTVATSTAESYARGIFFCPRMGRQTNV